jgi:ribosomal protein S18 acetylase RimI-like enzyme
MDAPLTPAEYATLRRTVGWPAVAPDAAAEALASSLAIATERDDDGRLVGLARAVGDGFYVVIVDVIVAPGEQDQGIGHRVLTRLLAEPAVKGAGHLALFAAPDAIELYESFGFRAEGGTYMERT